MQDRIGRHQNMLGLSEFHDWRGFPLPEFLREKHGVSTVRYSGLNDVLEAHLQR